MTSFHSGRISASGFNHTEERTVSIELQLVFESKLNLLLDAAQDIGRITDKLGIVKGTFLNGKPISLLIREWYHCAMGSL